MGVCSARKLSTCAGLIEEDFERAWAVAASSSGHHDASALRHYSRLSNKNKATSTTRSARRRLAWAGEPASGRSSFVTTT